MKTFEIKNSKVFVSDPCYDTTVWCTYVLNNVKPGKYFSKVNRFEDRISELVSYHESERFDELKFSWVDHRIGVDSGQCGFYDLHEFIRQREIDKHIDETYDKMPIYDQICEQTLSESGWGVIDFGVTASSGYGDGSYDLYVAKRGEQVVGMRLVFINEDNDEEFEDL